MVAEFAAVAYFWNDFRTQRSEGAVWVNPTPCDDEGGSDEAGVMDSVAATILNQVSPLGNNVYYTPNYGCDRHVQLAHICTALKAKFRNPNSGRHRKPDGLALDAAGSIGELLEVTTEKSYRRHRSAKNNQLNSALEILKTRVNPSIALWQRSPTAVDWSPAPDRRRILFPLFLPISPPYLRWICYRPNHRTPDLVEGWVLYEIHKYKTPDVNLKDVMETMAKLALGSELYKRLVDFLKGQMPEISRRIRPALESILEAADWLIKKSRGLLTRIVTILRDWGITIIVAIFVVLLTTAAAAVLLEGGLVLSSTVLAFLALAIVFGIGMSPYASYRLS
jgi:hypothetical protein